MSKNDEIIDEKAKRAFVKVKQDVEYLRHQKAIDNSKVELIEKYYKDADFINKNIKEDIELNTRTIDNLKDEILALKSKYVRVANQDIYELRSSIERLSQDFREYNRFLDENSSSFEDESDFSNHVRSGFLKWFFFKDAELDSVEMIEED